MINLHQSSFILGLRALAALLILSHHFALYAPLRDWAAPLAGDLLDWLGQYARATQVFFVVSGFVAARTLSQRRWHADGLMRFALQRYCRLGLPYLVVTAAIIPVYAFARGWVPDDVLGAPVTFEQFLAHVFFLQDILGYESLSAGLWFVCINFQLTVFFALAQWAAQRWDAEGLVRLMHWGLSIHSLLYFNLNPQWECWGLFFYPYFFMGVLVYRALQSGSQREWLLFQMLMLLALCYAWRWRIVIAMFFAAVLYAAERSGFAQRWPRQRLITGLGRISFSLFLVHFPVLVATGAFWARMGWQAPEAALLGLLVALKLSLAGAWLFHRWVEAPAARLSRRLRPADPTPSTAATRPNQALAFEN